MVSTAIAATGKAKESGQEGHLKGPWLITMAEPRVNGRSIRLRDPGGLKIHCDARPFEPRSKGVPQSRTALSGVARHTYLTVNSTG